MYSWATSAPAVEPVLVTVAVTVAVFEQLNPVMDRFEYEKVV